MTLLLIIKPRSTSSARLVATTDERNGQHSWWRAYQMTLPMMTIIWATGGRRLSPPQETIPLRAPDRAPRDTRHWAPAVPAGPPTTQERGRRWSGRDAIMRMA